MQNELDSAYGSFQEEAQKLFGELSQSDKAAEAPSVEKLLDADRRLRAGLVELTKHQKLARQYLDIQSEVSAAEARLREVLCGLSCLCRAGLQGLVRMVLIVDFM
mmetsp:Transcript_24234/g.54652  ORF Transcript_24234/g.54652 Transcript_24234/m.54652 type:complete len:105 (+) Transcript_24234:105-419(+)